MSITIRRHRVEDADALTVAVLESAAELGRWLPWCTPDYSVEVARAWIAKQVAAFDAGNDFSFVIARGERIVGGCGLSQIDLPNRRANLGYWVRTADAGQGVATVAVLALRDWAFANTSLIRLEIVVAEGNHGSRRVAERAGARLEGRQFRRLVVQDVAVDADMFSLTRT
jgi:ribosomal-protein-serine acetyltransferase